MSPIIFLYIQFSFKIFTIIGSLASAQLQSIHVTFRMTSCVSLPSDCGDGTGSNGERS